MFCSVFLDEFDWGNVKNHVQRGGKVYLLDTKPPLLQGYVSQNNMLYSWNVPDHGIPAFEHDTPFDEDKLKYTGNLLSISNPLFLSESDYSSYYKFMRPFNLFQGERTVVAHTLDELADNPGAYFCLTGTFDTNIVDFSLRKPLYVRTIYSSDDNMCHVLPRGCYKKYVSSIAKLLFCITESSPQVIQLDGVTDNASYHSMNLYFGRYQFSRCHATKAELLDMILNDYRSSEGCKIGFVMERAKFISLDITEAELDDLFKHVFVRKGRRFVKLKKEV